MSPDPFEGRPIRVLLVDDHALFRRGLALVFASEDDIEVVGEAADGREALLAARSTSPDVVLLDVRMPGTGGIEAARLIARDVPEARVVMLTISDDEGDLYEAIRAGAVGYLLKDASVEDLAGAVRSVAQGASLLAPSLVATLLQEFTVLANRVEGGRAEAERPHLTSREVEVLGHIARGLGNRAIAEQLFISENTVKNHVRNILEKLQLHTRTEAALYAVREEIIVP